MEEYRKMMMGHALEKGTLDDDFFTGDIRVLERSIEESERESAKHILRWEPGAR